MTEVRVGVVFRPQLPPEELRETVVAADEAGIDELWLWEDCFLEGGLTSAAAALAWSERLTVGIGLMPVPLRNPAVAAMEIATLARMFPDRFVPTLGHGVLDWMAQVGARVASPMTLLREHADAVRRLLHGETVSVTGRYENLDAVALDWPPVRVPPLIIGGRGPKTVALAGEVGDGVLLDSLLATPDYVASEAARAAEAAQAAGRPAPQVIVFAEIEPDVPALGDRARALIDELAAAGATSVILQGTSQHPDPGPLIAALSR
ncbi:Flavin-dependent oxidoreductase, luciferase family (includes alkanesulfonate monooxygenase SsuD and methylene tetrahydromethanopterin reductase) [Amycolatopsis lurida]|uniref:Oxidoreductase n=1 Tax=Amycolatopsis lurida NRRL 2430 TaxID=1460371 RepID=A0A2P2FZ98_AMYLU|nr:LLM class flavin-dependent oxidoreductase [Amycolatopsis lurida]KFU82044.1 oxidoreductase [Amycolatopsis lurida NRRL 2430]SEC43123.1 Flavin-dependent oxidoreductase, luciferase family (includes alkanesulfonate monooxygenase SsuD and methylene tetrahydromethanopterin reductase) [Amycolatopsis lurida]